MNDFIRAFCPAKYLCNKILLPSEYKSIEEASSEQFNTIMRFDTEIKNKYEIHDNFFNNFNPFVSSTNRNKLIYKENNSIEDKRYGKIQKCYY